MLQTTTALVQRMILAAMAIELACTGARAAQPASTEPAPLKSRLAATPPMGWNSWEAFRRDFDQDIIKSEADSMVSSGLRDAGYTYFVIDGGWKPAARASDGTLIPDPKKFPHGMKAVADYVHSKGLKFGLHQPAGIHDCPRLSPGSQGYEEQDAAEFIKWGVDFIKYDRCDYVYGKGSTTGSPDFDRIVVRQGDKEIFSTEAEAIQNQLRGLARIERREGCSSGRCVSAIGIGHGAIEIPDVTAPKDGTYDLDLYISYPYFGMQRFRSVTFFVTVDDSPPQRINLPYKMDQRYTTGKTTIRIKLKKGTNSITLDNPPSQEEEIRQSYLKMANALNRSGRPIMFSVCSVPRPWLWSEPIAHLYRCETDVTDRWTGGPGAILPILDRHVHLLDDSAVEFWPDPDMLEVGKKGRIDRPDVRMPKLTDNQYRAQFSLWSIMNAPLFISMDLREIDDATRKILLNREVIAVNQDPLGSPCRCVRSDANILILAKPLADGGVAVVFLNRGSGPADIDISATDLGIKTSTAEARDLWTGQTSQMEDGIVKAHVASNAVAMLRFK
jgi:alpha-galactosidase